MVNETVVNQVPSNCVVCGAPTEQVGGGHRRRQYCDNNNGCKQKAHRLNKLEQREEQIRERWIGFAPDTQSYLEWLMDKYGRDFAEGFGRIIKREQELVMPEPVLTLEEALQRAQWNNYTNPTSYLESTGRLFLSLLQTAGAETARQVAEAINHERGQLRQAMQPLITELLQALEGERAQVEEQERKIKCQRERIDKQLLQLHAALDEKKALAARVETLEQEITKYREVADLNNREQLEQQFMAIGFQIGYKSLLVGVAAGVDCWMSFMRDATDEELVKAIVSAKYYAENLIGLELEEQLHRANRRIVELERQQGTLKAVS